MIAARLRELIHEHADGLVEPVKWGKPNFSRDGDNLFYLAESKDHVKFALFEGADLPNPNGIVEGTGKKMRHIKVHSLEELDEAAIAGLIEAAVSRSE
ncbi:MAG: DUF1801 domain-containing protein [Persicimonas sp.]